MSTSIEAPTPREHLFQAYLTNMTEYMQMEFPQADPVVLRNFIKSEVAARSTGMIERLNIAKANNEDLSLSRSADQRLWPTLRMVRNVNPEAPKRGHSYGNITYYDNEDLLGVTLQHRDKIIDAELKNVEDSMEALMRQKEHILSKKHYQSHTG